MTMQNLMIGDQYCEFWGARISRETGNILASIHRIGTDLLEAKASAQHGQFIKMIRDYTPYNERDAQRFMAIVRHPWLVQRMTDTTQASCLPNHWTTLADLSSYSTEELQQAEEAGLITPDLKRKDARRLRAALGSPTPPNEEPECRIYAPPSEQDRVLARRVMQIVAVATGTDYCDISLPTRGRPEISQARQCGMYVLNCHLGWEATRVARLISRDRSTVTHGVQLIEDMRDDVLFDDFLNRLCGYVDSGIDMQSTAKKLIHRAWEGAIMAT